MENENLDRQQIIDSYRAEVDKLLRYIPWFASKNGSKVAKVYEDEALGEHSMKFPVYDSTLLSFVREIQTTKLIDRNYQYIYSRYRMKTVQDELNFIDKATITEMKAICGILSKYVMGGMVKGSVWMVAVEEGIFLNALLKMKDLLEFWDGPLA